MTTSKSWCLFQREKESQIHAKHYLLCTASTFHSLEKNVCMFSRMNNVVYIHTKENENEAQNNRGIHLEVAVNQVHTTV